jgi:predicted Zn-dependent protease
MKYVSDLIIIVCLFLPYFCTNTTSESTSTHKWQSKQVKYYLNKEANILSETAVRETFEKWNEKTGFQFVYSGRNKAGINKDGRNTVSFMLRWPADIPIGKVGYCKNWYDRKGSIIESDIILNMQITNFTTLHTNKKDAYYVEGVLSHEIGHMLGLNHSTSEKSIMKEKSDAVESYFKGIIDDETQRIINERYK